ncbi:NAD(P)-dependent oxidoreductase [Dietzia sp. Die43]|uniref:NAD-dependent epimerase/dehydratase family protein n=1 Tax=Dietzia sp. Die43 TaxID=2926011 RepID=UPI002117BECC|nr:NAD(P)-dependent oxidoreductase [Dietzia sp. Die43]
MKVAIVGASGFVGSAVKGVLSEQGHDIAEVRAPRVAHADAAGGLEAQGVRADELVSEFEGLDAVVNCSGNPDASEQNGGELIAANAISPAIVARAAARAGVRRMVHVSSAVVQGRRPQLDETDATEEFSAYAYSKAEGERLVRQESPAATIYRPPSVHAESRRVTAMTAKIAGSPLATVAAPGSQHSPQALIGNVASAIAFLATTDKEPPAIVIHPWEGLTSLDVMELLGGKRPFVVPRALARGVCSGLELAGRKVPAVAANARRVEMLWFGQDQADSWLTSAGWKPPYGRESWRALGEFIRGRRS